MYKYKLVQKINPQNPQEAKKWYATSIGETAQTVKAMTRAATENTTVAPIEMEASLELLDLAMTLCHTDKESFTGALDAWHTKWGGFINERAMGSDGKTHYVHKNTRSANLNLRRNMPWLWTWYDNPDLGIPNTNNAIEALNSDLKAKLNLHKGMTLERRKIFIQGFLNAHKPNG